MLDGYLDAIICLLALTNAEKYGFDSTLTLHSMSCEVDQIYGGLSDGLVGRMQVMKCQTLIDRHLAKNDRLSNEFPALNGAFASCK